MKITIVSTAICTVIDGVPVRIWEGLTADGVPCKVMVHRLLVVDADDSSRFDAELRRELPPGDFLPLHEALDRSEDDRRGAPL